MAIDFHSWPKLLFPTWLYDYVVFFFLRSRKFYIMNLDSNIKITYYWVCNRIFFFQFHDIKILEIFIPIHSNIIYIYIDFFEYFFAKKCANLLMKKKKLMLKGNG
jgi:hypothetical protein